MFTSRHVKHSRLLLRHARKYLRYKDDRLSALDREQIVAGMKSLREALRQKDRERIHGTADALDKMLHRLTPVTWESHWRENCEVILVAIVVAVGIRSYFLQPFKIPTGSMQPTLNGIIGYPSTAPGPNLLRQIGEFIVRGRNYINVVATPDDELANLSQKVRPGSCARITNNPVQGRLHRACRNLKRLQEIRANAHCHNDGHQNHLAILPPMRLPRHRCQP